MKKLVFVVIYFISSYAFAQHNLVQQLAQQVNQDSLVTYVKHLTGLLPIGNEVIRTRYKGTSGNTLTEEFIKQKLTSWGVAYDEVVFSGTGKNIIAKIPGRRTDRVMMMGAHFDAVGTANPDFTVVYPGADDNASGTAALLEAARVCAQQQFPITLHLAFWDEEEQNLVGSKYTAPDYMNKLVGYINHDMIGWSLNNDSLVEIHTANSGYSIEFAQRVINIISLYNVPLKAKLMNPGNPNTDHGAFWQNNLTAVGINEIYDGPLMNPHWHRPSDSLATMNISYFLSVARLGLTTLLHEAMDSLNLVGLIHQSINDNFAVYPNPVEDVLLIDNDEAIYVQVSIYTIYGNLVSSFQTNANTPISVQELESGIYILEISTQEKGISRKRFMKR
jgi:Zn-dependent M28 family amino/carboxypeptidase